MAARRLPREFHERKDVLNDLNDDDLINRYRFDRHSITFISGLLDYDLAPVTNRSHAITTVCKVLTTLRYLATGKFQLCNSDDHGLSQPTVSRVVSQTLDALSAPHIVRQFISFPTTRAEIHRHQRQFYQIANFPGVVGVIDGTHIQLQAPTVNENEYVNRHHYHSINTQVVFDSDDKIVDIVARWPGSTHDSRILTNSGLYTYFETHQHGVKCHLLGDSGYPCRRWLLTPFLRPQPGSQTAYNRAHKKTRSCVERGIGQLKRRFHVLHGEIRLSPAKTCKVITACAVLHNISKDRNVPLPDGCGGDGDGAGQAGQAGQLDGGPVMNTAGAGAGAGLRYREQFAANHFYCEYFIYDLKHLKV